MRAHSINKEFQTISLHFGFSKRLIWLSIRIVQIDNAYTHIQKKLVFFEKMVQLFCKMFSKYVW